MVSAREAASLKAAEKAQSLAYNTETHRNNLTTALNNRYSGPPQFSHADMEQKAAALRSGVGKAVVEGAKGAGKAFTALGNAFMTNEDFRGWTLGSIGLGAGAILAGYSVPSALATFGTWARANPQITTEAVKTVGDILDPNPTPTTIGGAILGIGKEIYD